MPGLAMLGVSAAAALDVGKELQRRCADAGNRDDVPDSERQNGDGEEIDLVTGVAGVTTTPSDRDQVAAVRALKRCRCFHLNTRKLPRAAVGTSFARLNDEIIGRGLPVRFGDDQTAACRLPNEGTLPRFAGELGETGRRHGVLGKEKARADGAGFFLSF